MAIEIAAWTCSEPPLVFAFDIQACSEPLVALELAARACWVPNVALDIASKSRGSVTLSAVSLHTVLHCSVHGYARVCTSIYIYIYGFIMFSWF